MGKEPQIIEGRFTVEGQGPPDLIPDETPAPMTKNDQRGFAVAAVVIIPALYAAAKVGLAHLGLGGLLH